MMRKFFISIIAFLLFFMIQPVYAIDEVVLDIDGEVEETAEKEAAITDEEWHFDKGGKTLGEKIAEIRAKEYNDISKANYLLEEILTKRFENSPIKTMHLFGYYRANFDYTMDSDDKDLTYNINNIDVGVNGKFRDDKMFYEARFRFAPHHEHNFFQYLPSNLYVATKAIPHHTVIVGNTRTATGYEGSKSSTVIPFISRSQISRNFGNTKQLGVRVKGNYSLLEYDLGGYSSDTYFYSFFPGTEFAGWLTLKPLGKTNGKYGSVKLGTGLTAGKNDIDYTVLGAYASYQYKKLYANFEWGKADGYNGSKGLSSKNAEGLYTTLGYKITPKLQILGRYDEYQPDKDHSNETKREYIAGLNYFIKGQAVKLMLNYVFCHSDVSKDSHRIILGTQLIL